MLTGCDKLLMFGMSSLDHDNQVDKNNDENAVSPGVVGSYLESRVGVSDLAHASFPADCPVPLTNCDHLHATD